MAITLNAPSQVRPYANLAAFPVTGVLKTVYIDEEFNKMYRWTGSAYVELSETDATTWGSITGDITSQNDLQLALNAKFDNPTGNSTQYLDGAGIPVTFPAFASADKMVTVGRNSTGSTLYKGTIVYISGSTGNRPNFVKAQANVEATSAGTFGVIEADIANNADGNCVTIGTIDNLDTRSSAPHPFTSDTLADGDTIYLSPTTAGFITNVKPYAPSHLVYLGKVVRTSPTNGTIVYRVQNGYELDELHDVAAQTPSDGQVLTFETATQLWKPKTIATGITIGTTAITSGTVGRVLFEGTGNVVQESANLFWDNTNRRLGIGTSSPAGNIDINANFATTGYPLIVKNTGYFNAFFQGTSANNQASFYLENDRGSTLSYGGFAIGGSTSTLGNIFGLTRPDRLFMFADGTNNVGYAIGTLQNVPLQFGTNNAIRATVFGNGNIGINTTTDAGFKLDVNGTARVKTTDSSTPLNILHSGSVGIQVEANANGYRLRLASSTTVASINTPDSYLSINSGGQLVVIGSTSTYNSAQFAVDSTTKGFLPPRMTTTQKNAIASPATGLMVYDTTLNLISVYNGTIWISL